MTPREKLLNEQAGLRAEVELYHRSPAPFFMANAVSDRRDHCARRLHEITEELARAETAPETA